MGIVESGAGGVLPRQEIHRLCGEGAIRPVHTFRDKQFQPASLDLRLGEKAYRIQSTFLPDNQCVKDKLRDHLMHEVDLRDGGVLAQGVAYLIELDESLSLPEGLRGKANPRSSTGRLDIFTRLVTDHSHRFDEVRDGYEGPLYVQVISRSFTLRAHTGECLNQLRFIRGDAGISSKEIEKLVDETPLLLDGESPIKLGEIALSGGLFLRVSLRGVGDTPLVGFKAKKTSPLLDLSKVAHYRIHDFWEFVFSDDKGRLVLDPEEFYILRSRERVRIPPGYGAEMVAYEPASGELRTHYAGFFDPGFGYGAEGEVPGTVAVMEVRAHDVSFVIEDGQRFCKIQLERMLFQPDVVYGTKLGSAYQYQDLTPSKHFMPLEISEAKKRTPPAQSTQLRLDYSPRGHRGPSGSRT